MTATMVLGRYWQPPCHAGASPGPSPGHHRGASTRACADKTWRFEGLGIVWGLACTPSPIVSTD